MLQWSKIKTSADLPGLWTCKWCRIHWGLRGNSRGIVIIVEITPSHHGCIIVITKGTGCVPPFLWETSVGCFTVMIALKTSKRVMPQFSGCIKTEDNVDFNLRTNIFWSYLSWRSNFKLTQFGCVANIFELTLFYCFKLSKLNMFN